MNNMWKTIEDNLSEMIELRRHFHQYPELSFEEVETPRMIARYLQNLGIETRTEVGGRGVVGVIKGDQPGKTVALRADFDALPLQDEKEVDYKSKIDGKMHACGHDAHTAILLTVAKALQEHKSQLSGNVVLIHQFAEELVPGGAKAMIEDGCLDGVDAIFGTHLWTPIPVGKATFHSQAIMAAADRFEIDIVGKGGHGAAPQDTIDPIVLGVNYVQMLQQIVSRTINPQEAAVITVGTFHSGDAFNIIPSKTSIAGTVRTFNKDVQAGIQKKMKQLLHSLCENAGAEYDFRYVTGYPPVVNHKEETKLAEKCAEEILGEDQCFRTEPLMVGEDFAYYLQKVPGTFFLTGAGNPEKAADYPHHHPNFDIDESSMLHAAKILASCAWNYLDSNK
ncbi:amidohydrolase [Bacillus ectoiniformans]|uniref:M20 metallopeptidase family protein n=1 Tax=Bacillus ectoiniformans TaxID=1494429 RepID=UPI00195E89E4|nr:amidohydrolase [Bacillus ectoiniformans]MBM7649216.1 amidohydrolase [Bacillus ectoiniformans]